jgi:hypothetical protein
MLDAKFNGAHFIFPSIALRYDAIRLRDPIAGARLAKLRAELHMCRVLILGLSLLGILNIINLFKAPFLIVIISELAILITVMSFIATYRHLNGRFTWGTCNHWLLLVEPGIIVDSKGSELHRVSTEDDSK